MKIMLWFLLLAILFQPGQSTNKSTQSFRIIPIPKREHGYHNFGSIAFMSQNDMDSFLKKVSTQAGWNNRQEFEDALRTANVNFTDEALVLLRHTEGSGSVQVVFETPILKDRKLLCEIRGKPFPPGYGGTADMAYYCFAVAVSKSHVSQVELQAVEGGFSERRLSPIVFSITEWDGTWVLQDSEDRTKRNSQETGIITLVISQKGQEIRITRKLHKTGIETLQELTYHTDGRGEMNPTADGKGTLKSSTKQSDNKLIVRFSLPSSTVNKKAIVNERIDEWKLSSDRTTLTQTSSFSSSSSNSDASNNPFSRPGAPNILSSPLNWKERKIFKRIS